MIEKTNAKESLEMTKKELISKLRSREDMTWDQATRIVNSIFDDISNDVAKGNQVYIPKFGRFFTTTIAIKSCKHPVTKKCVILPAHSIVRFHMAEEFRRKLKK